MKRTYLNLTGGLGNQLFQLAAALDLSDGGEVLIESVNGKPRINSNGEPDLASFLLPMRVSLVSNHRFNWLASKSTGFVLRSGVSPKRFEKHFVFKFISSTAASAVNIIALRRFVKIKVNSGVGFDKGLKSSRNQMLVGYFQTYRYAVKKSVLAELQAMRPITPATEIGEYKKLALEEKPLVVHVRLGDYKLENSFGILTKDYYKVGIAELWSTGIFNKIWLFSDEPGSAMSVVGEDHLQFVRQIPEINDSAAHTLEVMRLGTGYVIANSSFSWWASFLSYTKNPAVIAPTPWFIGQDEPVDLIPPQWLRRNGHL